MDVILETSLMFPRSPYGIRYQTLVDNLTPRVHAAEDKCVSTPPLTFIDATSRKHDTRCRTEPLSYHGYEEIKIQEKYVQQKPAEYECDALLKKCDAVLLEKLQQEEAHGNLPELIRQCERPREDVQPKSEDVSRMKNLEREVRKLEVSLNKKNDDFMQLEETYNDIKRKYANATNENLSQKSAMQSEINGIYEKLNQTETELRNLQVEYSKLLETQEELKKKLTNHEAIFNQKDEETKKLISKYDDMQQKYDESMKKISEMQEKINHLEEALGRRENELKHLQEKYNNLQGKYSDLVQHTGHEMAKELAKDEVNVENISQQCRPSVLREKYAQLSFQTASHLKNGLTKPENVSENTWKHFVANLFCTIYMVAAEEMGDLYRQRISSMNAMIHNPLAGITNGAEKVTELSAPLPKNIEQEMKAQWRRNAREIEAGHHVKTIMAKVKESLYAKITITQDDGMVKEMCEHFTEKCDPAWRTQVEQFVLEACILAWQMVIQQPPMQFETKGIGDRPQEELQKVLPSKGMDFSAMDKLVVHYYLEPVLKHGDQVLEKGRVVLRNPKDGNTCNGD